MEPQTLSIDSFLAYAATFRTQKDLSTTPSLYGITDGKAAGTWLEHQFKDYLLKQCGWRGGNSASGIDFPDLEIDLKVTSIKQPQSSCPFKSARQKIYGPWYHLLIFVYDKIDDNLVYFLPCYSEIEAQFICSLLNSPDAQNFLQSMIFWQDKRPITIDILKRLSIAKLAQRLGQGSTYSDITHRRMYETQPNITQHAFAFS